MRSLIGGGILLGLSGGADSVLLLHFLLEYRARNAISFPLLAVHVNHGIRGDEAERDEAFSKATACALGVDFASVHIDVPRFAQDNSLGLEEAARKLRYAKFNELIGSRSDISCIAVAHNSSDNLETVLFNFMRGAGTRGLAGIAPVRDNIIRPLIYVSKRDIQALLDEEKIEYVTDSTNFSCDYTRNYIRHDVIPKLARLNSDPERAVNRACAFLRADDAYISEVAQAFIKENYKNGSFENARLRGLHNAVLARVLTFAASAQGIALEAVHIAQIEKLLRKNRNESFKISLPGQHEFISECGASRIEKRKAARIEAKKLHLGENHFPSSNAVIILSENANDEFSLNVYKISIQAAIPFDIINSELFVRSKNDGDSYFYGGMTHKLKKLFNDKKIPPSYRERVPIFYDGDGIVWVPGFGVRSTLKTSKKLYVTIAEYGELDSDGGFYIPRGKRS